MVIGNQALHVCRKPGGTPFEKRGRLQAGASTGVVGKVVWQASASVSLRASAKLGTMGVELELGGSHRVSEFSTAGCSVVAGLQVDRPSLMFDLPRLLGAIGGWTGGVKCQSQAFVGLGLVGTPAASRHG